MFTVYSIAVSPRVLDFYILLEQIPSSPNTLEISRLVFIFAGLSVNAPCCDNNSGAAEHGLRVVIC